MLNKYIIYKRYEYWGNNGKTWSNWFRAILMPFLNTEEEAIDKIKEIKEQNKAITNSTKLKVEFEYRLEDVDLIEPPKPHYSKRGRPTKEESEKKKEKLKDFWRNK